MNCIIIDDDPLSRKVLEQYIDRTEYLTLIHSFSDAVEAINKFKNEEEIHLIFLDIEMPEMSGIDFLNSLKAQPLVIIVSSKEKYALEAFSYNVTDYILKPAYYARFYRAVERAKSQFQQPVHTDQPKNEERERDEIFIKNKAALIRLKYDDILWIEALENYVVFHTFDKKYTINFTMKSMVSKLPSHRFIRAHRSYIINRDKFEMIEDNSIIVKTKTGSKIIPIGKHYKEDLMNKIVQLGK
ncbi:MAG: response regulator transcription factor [Bacteroidetes bacterium]|jgi:DNA-binding LytR/AlgR family response regulator|nr:response regulator transcription factor [Bacteroidota bacterium]MBT6686712.1 response regulator transcription factor [Bacteroidota bacterium]MBT7143236.1 response regulator transcription factor [Bacteroidota bacterium]MBT7492875.1 response regulator transcription factor [Bacteroidota bacterium]